MLEGVMSLFCHYDTHSAVNVSSLSNPGHALRMLVCLECANIFVQTVRWQESISLFVEAANLFCFRL